MAEKEATKNQVKEVKAYARHIHMSPQKLRLVADLIRKTPVDTALEQLRYSSKKAANAVHNFNFNKENLYVKSITVDGGPVFKRLAYRARGQGFLIRKRTSHINVILEERKSKAKKSRSIFNRTAAKAEQKKHDESVEEGKVENDKAKPSAAPKSEEKQKKHLVDLKRRLFNRKSG
jgi:large subunit ribosomal protein L22